MDQAIYKDNKASCFKSQLSSLSTPPKKPKRKRNKKPFYSYGWQGKGKFLEKQYLSSSDYVFSEERYVNARLDADFVTIATFKSAYHYETLESGRKVRQLGRRKENLHSITACFLDIDSDLPIDENIIMQRCRAYGLPEPDYIVNTSKYHYQLQWVFKEQLICSSPYMLNYWGIVQRSLYEAFKDLGADLHVISDATRYLRNPHKQGAVNFKYPDKPEVRLVYQGSKTSLTKLYNALKNNGFIKQSIEFPKAKKSKRLGNGVPLSKVQQFISTNPSWTGSYKQLATITGVCERSLHRLREKQLIKIESFRVGSIYKIRLNFSDCLHYKEVNIKHFSLSVSSNLYMSFIRNFNKNGLNEGFRNMGVFAFSLYLNYSGKNKSEILKMLTPGLEKCRGSGNSFSDKEILKTVESACREEYKYYYNPKGELFQKLLAELGNDVYVQEKIPIQHLKADNKASITSLVDTSLSQSKNGNLKSSEIRYSRNMQGILESIRIQNESYEHKFKH